MVAAPQNVTAPYRYSLAVLDPALATSFPYKRAKEIKRPQNRPPTPMLMSMMSKMVVASWWAAHWPRRIARATNRPVMNDDSGLGKVKVWWTVQPPYRIDLGFIDFHPRTDVSTYSGFLENSIYKSLGH